MTRDPASEDKTYSPNDSEIHGGAQRTDSVAAPAAARRRLLKGLVGGAPFVLTVASRPVQGAFCTPSAWVSGNLSDQPRQLLSCGGKSLRYWMTNHDNRWSSTGYSPGSCAESTSFGLCVKYASNGTRFHAGSVGRGGVFPGGRYGNKSLMEVLWMETGEDPFKIGGHIVAALLNAASTPDYGLSVAQVVDMYRQLEYQGFYQPSAGQPMFAQDVVLFIRNTFS